MMELRLAIWVLTFGSIGLLSGLTMPLVIDRYFSIGTRRAEEASRHLDEMFVEVQRRRLFLLYTFSPIALGIVGILLFHNLIAGVVGGVVGLTLPTFVIKDLEARRLRRFNSQLVDGLMILTGSLKAGLSMLQAIEVLVEEMPPPVSQEFGLVLRENAMGVPLDESLERLNSRMKSDELNLIVTAVLVARDSGGDLTRTFTQLMTTIREKRKLTEKARTLTTQGKIQGIVMSIIPIFFGVAIYMKNPEFLKLMMYTEDGRVLLAIAGFLWIIGVVLLRVFSRIEI